VGSGIVSVGTRLGPYEITGTLGKGGMAEVYLGQHTTLGREVAIKTLPANLAKEDDFRKRFEREARTIAALKHPNIVGLFDSGEADGTYYIVMEYFKGGDLSDYMKGTGPLKIDETRQLVAGIGGALDYAHQQGVVHRDIKPSNVMLHRNNGDLRPMLTDFGIARIMGGTTRITRTGMVGTFDYIAPEQIRDATDVDGRADIYSLGVMAFQLLTGRLPFTASNPGALLIAHLNQPAPNPRDLRADIPEGIAEATLRALEKDPARRFQTAGEFAAALA
jgi:serine/threonine-protein kinase